MGLFKKGSHYSLSPDPDPRKFAILKIKKVGSVWVSKIRYHNCTNYEGVKILVTSKDPTNMHSIDPHFLVDGFVVARFVPTEEGWHMANKFSEIFDEI